MLCLLTLHECALISHSKLTPEWTLIQVNFDPIQELGPKVRVGALLRDYGTCNTLHNITNSLLPRFWILKVLPPLPPSPLVS